jgi:hypothetical protein
MGMRDLGDVDVPTSGFLEMLSDGSALDVGR